ncbi:MAG: HEAT repeat domain-containing protein [Bryobacteraceae bacterium]
MPPDLDPIRHAAIALVMLDAHLGAQLDLITRVLLLHLSIHAEHTDYDDPDEERLAADALRRFGVQCQAAVPALLEGLKDEWPPVRKYAAAALIRIQPPAEQVVPALESILREEAKEHNEPTNGDYTYYIRWALDQITRQRRER